MYTSPFKTGIDEYQASNDILHSTDTARTKTSSTPTKVKEIEIVERIITSSEFRLSWDMKVTAGTGYAQVYKNGVAYGTQKTETGGAYVNKTDDLDNFKKGDLVQLYIWIIPSGANVWIQNFRILGVKQLPATQVIPHPARKLRGIAPGTVISKVKKKKRGRIRNIFGMDITDIHQVLGSEKLRKPPIIGGPELVLDWWTLVLGSPKEKAHVLGDVFNIEYSSPDYHKTVEGWDWQGAEIPTVTFPGFEPIKLPEFKFPDITGGLKNVLIYGGLALAGLYLIGKFIGRRS